jgi:hypothetical protein
MYVCLIYIHDARLCQTESILVQNDEYVHDYAHIYTHTYLQTYTHTHTDTHGHITLLFASTISIHTHTHMFSLKAAAVCIQHIMKAHLIVICVYVCAYSLSACVCTYSSIIVETINMARFSFLVQWRL